MPNLTRIIAGALIAVSVLLGVLAFTLARRPAPAVQTQATFPVVVAMRALAAGQPIPADALRVRNLPINPTGAFTDPSLIAGRVPVVDIGTLAPVLETQLSSGIAERIEPGERAVAIRVDESNAVGNRLHPGNIVDVFFTLKRDSMAAGQGEVERTQARLLMSRLRVLAYGNVTANGAPDMSTAARTAVLAVPLADVDKLALAEGAGRLVLALRNPRDTEMLDATTLPQYTGVLKTAAGADVRVSTRAAAGIALDDLSGANAGRESTVHADGLRNGTRDVAGSGRGAEGVRDAHGSIEVIRAGRSETVRW